MMQLHRKKGVAYKEIEVKDGGTIVGTVKFDGDVPAAKMLKWIKMSKHAVMKISYQRNWWSMVNQKVLRMLWSL